MRCLSIKTCGHDTNYCYFDGEKYSYWKSERYEQVKHHVYADFLDHEKTLKSIWNIDFSDVDEICISFVPFYYGMKMSSNHNSFPATDYYGLDTKTKVVLINHHYAHALSTYMLCDKTPDVHFVIDGVGFDVSYSVYKNNKIVIDGHSDDVGSIGEYMERSAKALGIQGEIHDLAGKLMGLQTYGKIDKKYLDYLNNFDINQVHQIFNAESWCTDASVVDWIQSETGINWIRTVHHRVGQVLIDHFSKFANADDLITYSGGVAQNVIWNTQLKVKFPNLIIPPHCGDEGLSIGAMEYLRRKYNLPKITLSNFPYSQTDESVEEPSIDTIQYAAKCLSDGKIIGWYQGNGEIGPRALGNRSILMDARLSDGKEKVNKIKKRENYRPFGASILKEYVGDYFDLPNEDFDNPYMLFVAITKGIDLPSITHVDSTCRIQTVKNDDSSFRKLLQEFFKLTGSPVLLNTSLNVGGRPIAGHVADALELFNMSSMDTLIVGNDIYNK